MPPVDELADRGCAQRRDPVDAVGREVAVDAGLRDHAAVPHQHHPPDAEAVADLAHLAGQSHRVAGVAGEGLDRDRTAIAGAEEAVDDLRAVAPAIPRIAALRHGAGVALHVARGHVVEDEIVLSEMAPGELALDRALSRAQPVHGGVEFVDADAFDAEQGGEGGCAGRSQLALDAQLGAGPDQAGDDHGDDEGPAAIGPVEDDAVEADVAKGAENGADGAVRPAGAQFDVGVVGIEGGSALEGAFEGFDGVFREGGEVAQGALLGFSVLPVGLSEEVAAGVSGPGWFRCAYRSA